MILTFQISSYFVRIEIQVINTKSIQNKYININYIVYPFFFEAT